MQQRKDRNRKRLEERHGGKKDLLDSWMELGQGHTDYTRDLKKRVDHHRNDLAYRGYL